MTLHPIRVSLFLALLAPFAARAGERNPHEVCDNSVDDDADGQSDEGVCHDDDGPSSPVSGRGVAPELWHGNPNCSDLGFENLLGFKIDQTPTPGIYTFTSNDGVLNGPEDPLNHISVDAVHGGNEVTSFDYTSTLPIAAVFVKAQGGNAYVYETWETSDTGLGTPGEAHQISHVTFCYGYAVGIAKDAYPEYTREVAWSLTKDVEPTSDLGFIGDSLDFDYTVSVDKEVSEYGFSAFGSIDVHNPSPWEIDYQISDTIGDIIPSLDCPEGASGTLGPDEMLTCSYTVELPDKEDRTNTVTVVSDTPGMIDGEASAEIVFGEPTTLIGFDEVAVVDSSEAAPEEGWMASDDATWTYTATVDCPTNPAEYIDGAVSIVADNTATIVETGASDTENINVTCYAPAVSKDVTTSYRRSWDWIIDKSVEPAEHSGFPGDSFWSNYTVSVDSTVSEDQFNVSGSITVGNPHPSESLTATLADSLPGAVLDCGGNLMVAAGSSASCDYSADLDTKQDGVNTATATFNGIDFTASAPYVFGDPSEVVGSPTIQVTDTNGEMWSAEGDSTWTYQHEFTCSTDLNDYSGGYYNYDLVNTATIEETGASDSAQVDVTCVQPGSARVVKNTEEGDLDIGQLPFEFQLFDPDGILREVKTLDGSGEVAFDTELVAAGAWEVIEVPPYGWVYDSEPCILDVVYPDAAGHEFSCTFDNREMSVLAIEKLTGGVADDSIDWNFALYEGPDGFGGAMHDHGSIPADLSEDGMLYLGNPLDPTAGWTLCELGVPAGWSPLWNDDKVTLDLYNPNADDPEPEDLGNRCLDLGEGTDLPLATGAAQTFFVDNVPPPGGAPRTPGYWKNWSTCSNGNQVQTAADNGGPAEGWYLVDDLLPIVWDDIEDDDFEYLIDTCEAAVATLSNKSMEQVEVGKSGKLKDATRASDPAYRLARNLLAYQLNQRAGACLPAGAVTSDGATIQEVAEEAELLLDGLDFDGTGWYLKKKKTSQDAGELAEILDAYNNGDFCTGEAPE